MHSWSTGLFMHWLLPHRVPGMRAPYSATWRGYDRLRLQSPRPKNRGTWHETAVISLLFICADELGGCCGSVLLRYEKEGSVVDRQLYAPAREVEADPITVRWIESLEQFIAME